MDYFNEDNKYILYLRWRGLTYKEGVCVFKDAYFSGPVLKYAERIEPYDSISLDFYKQYYVLVDNVYIGKLSWGKVSYLDDRVSLSYCILQHDTELHKVPKIRKNDILVIDCSNHERDTHDYYPVYKAVIVNEDKYIYNF